jgi:uncharacterized protein YfaS (alpha-2-macroglobulin family)
MVMNNWRLTVMGLVAAVSLAACGQSGTDTDQPADQPAPDFTPREVSAEPSDQSDVPQLAIDTRFEFVRYSVEVDGDAPRLCLGFTQPLDPQTDYSPYIVVEPEAAVAIATNGQSLCLGGLGFGSGQSVLLRAGLPSASGAELSADEIVAIEFGDRPAYVGIAGDGVILPRLEADGLAIETVNVEAVKIELWRVTDRALAFRTISSGYTAGEGDYAWLSNDENPVQLAERIWEGEMETQGALNAPVTTVFPLSETVGRLRPGAYFIEIDDAAEADDAYRNPARTKRWLIITDLALTAYRSADGLDYVVRSLQTAQPVSGVRVELVARSNDILGTAMTDARGRAHFDGPLVAGEGAMAPRLLTAYGPDNDFAVLDLQRNPVDLSAQGIGGRSRPDGADGFIYLDRGIYRPGETVEASVLLRDAAAMAVSDRPGDIILFGPNGIESARWRFDNAPAAGGVSHAFELPRQAARGEWRMVVELDGYGRIAQSRFSVEDFVPQRIALELDADDETPMGADDSREIGADVRFLYGAPGVGLVVEGRIRVEADPNPFPEYRRFRFGQHDEAFRETSRDLPSTIADGAGHASVVVTANNAGAQSSVPLRIRTVISAIEPGGRAVSDDVRLPYRPSPVYLGLDARFDGRARRNEAVAFDAIAVSPLGQVEARQVSWQLIRVDWNYDWYRANGGRWQWRRTRSTVLIESGEQALPGDGTGRIEISALDWGDYQLTVTDSEHDVSASTGFWVGWGSRPTSGVEAPDRVRLSGPDEAVSVGGTAQLGIMPPYAGEAEIVIASDRVLETRSISVPEEGAQLSFSVTEDWGAGVYAMVSVFTPRDPVAQPRPRRAVGVTHIPVDTADRTLTIALNAPELVRPRQSLTLDVQASGPIEDGAWMTLAAVDEGILALTRFESPDPLDWFFGKTSLDVELLDDYGRLLDPNQGAAAAVRSGGDQIGGAGLTVVPTQTVALFSGPVAFDDDGRAQVVLELPDFNGELRLMAVAWSSSGVGQTAQPMTVRDAVPAELILPRFLAPGDVSTTTLTVDNVEGAAGTYVADIRAGDPVEAESQDSRVYAAGQRHDVRYPIAANDTGIGEVALEVSGPDAFAVQRSYPIEVRSAWLPYSTVARARLAPGENWSAANDALAAFMPGTGEVSISFSPTPLDEAALLQSLSRYPYGCTEQITSRAMPLLYADQLASLADAEGVEGARLRVQDAISTLLSRQASDGAIGLWRVGDRGASVWLGAYAVDFLSRAKEAGYSVPDAALERAYVVLEHIAEQEMWRANGYDSSVYRWIGQSDTDQRLSDRSAAYALYVLARAGRVDRSRLRYMHDEKLDQIGSPLARAHIAAGLHLIGDRARSRNAFAAAQEALGFENRGNWYQTPRRDLAGVLALAAESDETDLVAELADRVVRDLPEPARLTTQEKAFLLLAARGLSGDAVVMNVEGDGFTASNDNRQFAFGNEGLSQGASFTNAGEGNVWVTQIAHGDPVVAPAATSEGMTVTKRIRGIDGSAVDLANLVQGDRMIIELSLRTAETRTIPAIVIDLLPAGFEIEAIVQPNEASHTGAYSWLAELTAPRIAEARDDRFVAAVDVRNRDVVRFAYIVRAVTPGQYVLPGVVAEDMYRPDVFARSEGGSVAIAPRG